MPLTACFTKAEWYVCKRVTMKQNMSTHILITVGDVRFLIFYCSTMALFFLSLAPAISHLSGLFSIASVMSRQTCSALPLFEERWCLYRYHTKNQFPIDWALFYATLPKCMLWSGWTAVQIVLWWGCSHLLGLAAVIMKESLKYFLCLKGLA